MFLSLFFHKSPVHLCQVNRKSYRCMRSGDTPSETWSSRKKFPFFFLLAFRSVSLRRIHTDDTFRSDGYLWTPQPERRPQSQTLRDLFFFSLHRNLRLGLFISSQVEFETHRSLRPAGSRRQKPHYSGARRLWGGSARLGSVEGRFGFNSSSPVQDGLHG